jgi:hypothetical protein
MKTRQSALLRSVRAQVLFACAVVAWSSDARSEPAYTVDWVRQFGTVANDKSLGVAVDPSGNVYATGVTYGSLAGPNHGSSDAFVSSHVPSGTEHWLRQLGNSGENESRSIAADGQGSLYFAGYTQGSLDGLSAGGEDAFVGKYDSSGSLQWIRQLGTEHNDFAAGVSVDRLGNVFVAGYTHEGSLGGPNVGGNDAFLSMYDRSGEFRWSRQWGSIGDDFATGLSADGLGNVYVTGYTAGSMNGENSGGYDAFVTKYDAAGSFHWTKQIGTNEEDRGLGIAADPSGNLYVSGFSVGSLAGPSSGSDDAFLVKLDPLGTIEWSRQLGTTANDISTGVAVDGLGNVYSAGSTGGALGGPNAGIDNDAFVAKYDSSGTLQWTKQLGTEYDDRSLGVSADGAGNVYIAGSMIGDAFVARLVPSPPPPGPRIVAAAVGGLTWQGNEYAIPSGDASQLAPLPWTRINQVSFVFDHQVQLGEGNAILRDGNGATYALFGPLVDEGPEPGTVRVTWMLEDSVESGDYEFHLSDAVTDDQQNALDGEWSNGESPLSGDGIAGGDFIYQFRVLTGDVNQDGIVSILDWIEVRNRQGDSLAEPEYSIFHDIDRRGSVDAIDLFTVPQHVFTTLPDSPSFPDRASGAAVPEPTSLSLAAAALTLVWYRVRRALATGFDRRGFWRKSLRRPRLM